jgi:DNA-binding PadR family transcriptional regulator
MSREAIGTFELMVLLAVLRVGQDAYGVVIAHEIEESTNRRVLVASVYAALERLETKDMIRHRLGEATPARGGRAKKYFSVTAKGLRAARETRRQLVGLWTDVPSLYGGTA